MKRRQIINKKTVKVLKVTAHIISSVTALFFILMFTGEGLSGSDEISLEGIFVGIFGVLLVAGTLAAYFKAGPAGIYLIIVGICFAVFIFITAGSKKLIVSTLLPLPFVIPGIIFLITDRFFQKKDSGK